MSLSTQTNRTDHTENGVTTVFPFDFKIFSEADLVVISVDQNTLTETTLSLGTDYTISGVNAESGSITKAAGTSGDGLVIKRVVDLTQLTVLRNQSDFFPATHEKAFDRIVMQNQQQQEELDRALKFSPASTSRGTMPEPVPGYAVGFDANGDLAAVPNTGADQTLAWTAADNLIRSDLAATTGAPRNIKVDGAVVDGVTDDSTAVAATLAAVPLPGAICVPGESNIGTARIANQRGVSIEGPGLLEYTPSSVLGTRVQNAKGRDRLSWGSEYLYQFLVKFIAGTASTIRLSGDSTTAQSNQYGDYLTSMLANWPSVTVTKAGFSGKHTGDWLSTYLAGDITANADVLIWHWGMNDCSGQGRTLTQFEADLRAGLTTYRATRPIASNGIILMTPNASSDGTQGRDERFQEKIGRIIKNVAEDFQCAYFDTYGIFQDGYVGIGEWIDDPYADGLRGVHPEPPFAQAIAGEVLDLLIPPGVRRIAGDGGVSNSYGSTNPLTTDAPTTYPAGVSIRRATTANGWPNDGFVVTFYENTNKLYALQINYAYNTPAFPQIRHYASGSWKSFGLVVTSVNGTASIAGAPAFLAMTSTAANVGVSMSRLAANAAYIETQTNGSTRWRIYTGLNDGESGSDAGTSFGISAHTDAAAFIDYVIHALRKSGGLITLGGTTKRPVLHTGQIAQAVGSNIASATTITAPAEGIFHVTGTTAIATINLPYAGFTGTIKIIPDAAFTTTTAGNIGLASTAVVGKVLEMTYDGTKWWPSY